MRFVPSAFALIASLSKIGMGGHEKFPFYAGLGVPEVWVFDRETREPELYTLVMGPAYQLLEPYLDGWIRSPATGIEFRQALPKKVWVRIAGDAPTAKELGDA